MQSFTAVPHIVGDTSILARLATRPRDEFLRVALLGDSQETAPGGNGVEYVDVLNAIAWRQFGVQRETRLNYAASYGGGSPWNVWCCRGTNLNMTNSSLPGNRYLPNIPRQVTNATANGPTVQLQPAGDTNAAMTANRASWFPVSAQSGMRADIFCFRAATSPPNVRVRVLPTTSSAINVFDTVTNTFPSTGLNLNGAGTDLVRFSTPTFNPNPSKPYMQVLTRGFDGTNDAAGLEYVGMRYVLAHNAGLTFDSFSAGGYRVTDFLTNHAAAGPMLAGLGPWAALILSFGVNDAGTRTAEQFRDETRTLVTTLRTWLGSIVPIVFVSDTPSNGFTAPQLAQFDLYASGLAQICADTPATVLINQRRMLHEMGFTNPTGAWTVDGVHHTPLSSAIRANLLWEAILGRRISRSGRFQVR